MKCYKKKFLYNNIEYFWDDTYNIFRFNITFLYLGTHSLRGNYKATLYLLTKTTSINQIVFTFIFKHESNHPYIDLFPNNKGKKKTII